MRCNFQILGQEPRGTVLHQSQGPVKHLSFSGDGTSIAACVGQSVLVIDSQVAYFFVVAKQTLETDVC